MCSQNAAEIESVKTELFKAGVKSETRNNPVAQSLGIDGIELWVPDERDFFTAASVFARMQPASSAKPQPGSAGPEPGSPPVPEVVSARNVQTVKPPSPGPTPPDPRPVNHFKPEELEETSSLLQKEIEEMLERDSELATECASLRGKIHQLNQALAESQANLGRERESRAALETARAQEVSALQSALEGEGAQRQLAEHQLERERGDHKRVAQQLAHDRDELQQHLKARDEALQANLKKLESQAHYLRTQEAAMLKLRKDVASLGLERNEVQNSLAKARAELTAERQARAAAEARAQAALTAQESLTKQFLEQRNLHEKLQAHWTNLNSLYSKVHAKRVSQATT